VKGAFGLWRSVDNTGSWQRLVDFPLGRLDQITVLAADPWLSGGCMWASWARALCMAKAAIVPRRFRAAGRAALFGGGRPLRARQ
jgi:hypothetical protein